MAGIALSGCYGSNECLPLTPVKESPANGAGVMVNLDGPITRLQKLYKETSNYVFLSARLKCLRRNHMTKDF